MWTCEKIDELQYRHDSEYEKLLVTRIRNGDCEYEDYNLIINFSNKILCFQRKLKSVLLV